MATTAPAVRSSTSTRRSAVNRRRPVPLHARLPDRAQIGAWCRRAVRVGLPGALVLVALVAVGGALTLGYRWLTASPRFALAGVEVRGAREMTATEVERAVRPELGENLFRLPLAAIERRLRAEPWVADVAVRRRLPDHLIVEIEERRPAAVVDLGGLYLADAGGSAFKRADLGRGEAAGLPVVTGIDRDTYRRRPDEARARIRRALAAAAAYDEDPRRPPVGEVHDDPHRGITLYTREPVVALRLGRADTAAELRRRLAVFDAAWAALAPAERAAVSAIHVDREGAPVRATIAFADSR